MDDSFEVVVSEYEDDADPILSKLPPPEPPAPEPVVATPEDPLMSGRSVPLPPPPPPTTVLEAQSLDADCRKLAEQLRRAQRRRKGDEEVRLKIKEGKLEYEVFRENQLLHVQFKGKRPRLILPASLRDRALHEHHLSFYAGHFGVRKTYARLAARYWWPRMRDDVKAFAKKCALCLAYSRDPAAHRWLTVPIGTPFEIVAVDIFGPLQRTTAGCEHILVLMDHHTRWVELVALREVTAMAVAEAIFCRWISRWGVMRTLLSDNGPQFVSEVLRQLCTVYGIKKVFASPYHPRGNALIESYMRTLKSTLLVCTSQ